MNFQPTDHPIENDFPKLVRDNIPALYEKKTGKPAQIRTAVDDAEYLNFLLKKMVEEAYEVQFSLEHNNLLEELTDVTEIIETILNFKGWNMQDLKKIQNEKREKNGGFEKRLILLSK